MTTANPMGRMLYGGAAGLAGSLTLLALQTASNRWLPGTMPSYREDPGEFMVRKAEALLPDEFASRYLGFWRRPPCSRSRPATG